MSGPGVLYGEAHLYLSGAWRRQLTTVAQADMRKTEIICDGLNKYQKLIYFYFLMDRQNSMIVTFIPNNNKNKCRSILHESPLIVFPIDISVTSSFAGNQAVHTAISMDKSWILLKWRIKNHRKKLINF